MHKVYTPFRAGCRPSDRLRCRRRLWLRKLSFLRVWKTLAATHPELHFHISQPRQEDPWKLIGSLNMQDAVILPGRSLAALQHARQWFCVVSAIKDCFIVAYLCLSSSLVACMFP